jgi:hypothetical protein
MSILPLSVVARRPLYRVGLALYSRRSGEIGSCVIGSPFVDSFSFRSVRYRYAATISTSARACPTASGVGL